MLRYIYIAYLLSECETLYKIQKAGLSVICYYQSPLELILKCLTSAIVEDSETNNRGVYVQLIV
jgi:hypothetical protein